MDTSEKRRRIRLVTVLATFGVGSVSALLSLVAGYCGDEGEGRIICKDSRLSVTILWVVVAVLPPVFTVMAGVVSHRRVRYGVLVVTALVMLVVAFFLPSLMWGTSICRRGCAF